MVRPIISLFSSLFIKLYNFIGVATTQDELVKTGKRGILEIAFGCSIDHVHLRCIAIETELIGELFVARTGVDPYIITIGLFLVISVSILRLFLLAGI